MVKKLMEKITFRQVTIVRGLLFSLYLVFLVNNNILLKSNSALYLYLGLLGIRVVFNYNLDVYKYKLCPMLSLMIDSASDNESQTYELSTIDDEAGTGEYLWKTSNFYLWTYAISNLLSMLLSGSILVVALFYHAAYILSLLNGLDINMVTTVLVGSLLAAIIYILFSSGNKVKREEIKGELKE